MFSHETGRSVPFLVRFPSVLLMLYPGACVRMCTAGPATYVYHGLWYPTAIPTSEKLAFVLTRSALSPFRSMMFPNCIQFVDRHISRLSSGKSVGRVASRLRGGKTQWARALTRKLSILLTSRKRGYHTLAKTKWTCICGESRGNLTWTGGIRHNYRASYLISKQIV